MSETKQAFGDRVDKDDEELLNLAELYSPLLKSLGFQVLSDWSETAKQVRYKLLAIPQHERPSGVNGPTDEFLRGAIFGIGLPFRLVRDTVEQANELRRNLQSEVIEE